MAAELREVFVSGGGLEGEVGGGADDRRGGLCDWGQSDGGGWADVGAGGEEGCGGEEEGAGHGDDGWGIGGDGEGVRQVVGCAWKILVG